jgi:prepilin-type N-terminal cleavage/methylation domain-containing protein
MAPTRCRVGTAHRNSLRPVGNAHSTCPARGGRHTACACYFRRGYSIIELLVATALLATLLTVCVQLSGTATAEQRAVGQRQAAMNEAANVLERLSIRPWDELTDKNLSELPLSAAARQSVPEARLEVRVVQPAGQPGVKRISVLVRWPDRDGRPERTVRLTAWRYRAAQEVRP